MTASALEDNGFTEDANNSINVVQKRLLLEEREKQLHEQLTEHTRRLQNARAQVKLFEDSLELTIKELHDVRQQRNELTELMEGAWNGPPTGQTGRLTS